MAQQILVNVYQINSMDPIPVGNVVPMGFPSAGIVLRAGSTAPLSTGVYCYGQIQLVANGSTFLVPQTQAQLVTLCNS